MKQRYLLQRNDTEMYFCHPSEIGEFTQWTRIQHQAHQWVDLDRCLAAAQTSEMIWGIPASVRTVQLPYEKV